MRIWYLVSHNTEDAANDFVALSPSTTRLQSNCEARSKTRIPVHVEARGAHLTRERSLRVAHGRQHALAPRLDDDTAVRMRTQQLPVHAGSGVFCAGSGRRDAGSDLILLRT